MRTFRLFVQMLIWNHMEEKNIPIFNIYAILSPLFHLKTKDLRTKLAI